MGGGTDDFPYPYSIGLKTADRLPVAQTIMSLSVLGISTSDITELQPIACHEPSIRSADDSKLCSCEGYSAVYMEHPRFGFFSRPVSASARSTKPRIHDLDMQVLDGMINLRSVFTMPPADERA